MRHELASATGASAWRAAHVVSDASRCTVARHDADANRSESGQVSMNKELQPKKHVHDVYVYIYIYTYRCIECGIYVCRCKGVKSFTWV